MPVWLSAGNQLTGTLPGTWALDYVNRTGFATQRNFTAARHRHLISGAAPGGQDEIGRAHV